MDSGYYAAFTGLLAGTQALELAANNLANISTTGYKAQREFYKSLTASLDKSSPAAVEPVEPSHQQLRYAGRRDGGRASRDAGAHRQ